MPTYQRGYKRPRAGYKKKRVVRRMRASPLTSRRRLVSLIRRTTMKVGELKENHRTTAKADILHNLFQPLPPSVIGAKIIHLNNAAFTPPQGTGEQQRVGDEIYTSGYKIKLLIGQQADRPNVNWRWLVLSVPKGSSIVYANWFKATSNNVMLDDPNTDFVKVIKSGYWRPNEAGLAGGGGDEYTFTKKIWVPYKKRVKFGPADGAQTHNDDDLYFVLMGYDAFGTLQTDIVGYVQSVFTLMYRDP